MIAATAVAANDECLINEYSISICRGTFSCWKYAVNEIIERSNGCLSGTYAVNCMGIISLMMFVADGGYLNRYASAAEECFDPGNIFIEFVHGIIFEVL
jgi:hypothetical protein